jgi:hypothetical protein
MGVGMHEGMPDGPLGVSELAGDLPAGHAITMGPANRAIVVHGHHVRCPRYGATFSGGTSHRTEGSWGGSRFCAHFQMSLEAGGIGPIDLP